MICKNCKNQVDDRLKYCPFCGGKIEKDINNNKANEPSEVITEQEFYLKSIKESNEYIAKKLQNFHSTEEHIKLIAECMQFFRTLAIISAVLGIIAYIIISISNS